MVFLKTQKWVTFCNEPIFQQTKFDQWNVKIYILLKYIRKKSEKLSTFERRNFSKKLVSLFFVKASSIEEHLHAVVCISESQWLNLWSKWPIFDLMFYNTKMQLCSGPLGSTLPLTGAFKWGTVWDYISTGIETMHGWG